MALTVSIQRGSQTIVAADGLTINVTISSVTQANSIVMYTQRGESGGGVVRAQRHSFEAFLTSSTNLRFVRFESASAGEVVIEWTVIELDASAFVSLQFGSEAASTDPDDVTISSVTVADCSVILSAQTDRANYDNLSQFSGHVSAATTLRLDFDGAPGANDATVRWTVVEWDLGAINSVQNGTVTLDGDIPGPGEESDTATISAVTLANAAVFHQGQASGSTTDGRHQSRMRLTSTTQVTADRNDNGTTFSMLCRFTVVEFVTETVTAGSVNFTTSETSENPTFTELGADYAVVGSYHTANAAGTGGDPATNGGPELRFSQKVSTPPDDIVISRTTTGIAFDVAYDIIDFTAGEAVTLVTPYSDIPKRAKGGVNTSTTIRQVTPINLPVPFAEIPRGLPGGESFLTFLRMVTPPSRPQPSAEIVRRRRGGESFLTQFHDVPAAPAVNFFSALPPPRVTPKKGGRTFFSEYHEAPPPPPLIAFAPMTPIVLRPRRPPLQGSFEVTRVFPVKAQIRRGLYEAHGLYHVGADFAVDEPFAVIAANSQTIQNSIETTVDFAGVAARTGFGAGVNMDQWGLVDAVGEKIVFLHDGYYVVSITLNWENNSTGRRSVDVNYFSGTGLAIRLVMGDDRPASFITQVSIASDPQPFQAGGWLTCEVFQASGGPIALNSLFLSVMRISKHPKVFQ